MLPLVQRNCVHRDQSEGLTPEQVTTYNAELPDWKIVQVKTVDRIRRSFKFKNFSQAIEFTNLVGEISEEQDHHPVIVLEWANARISWWTHTVKGLSENDFIMAAKTDALYAVSKTK
jgi:4a-hydroxytetrahydrobiopterin dehydratase